MSVNRQMESKAVDMPEVGHSINKEFAELTKYVEMITHTIRDMETPVLTTSDQLPQATVHLNDLARMTEEGTHRVLNLTEAIETNRASMQSAVEQLQKKLNGEHASDLSKLVDMLKADQARIMDIHMALSFQDLVAQRVAKLVTILNEFQHKLLKLVVIIGVEQKKDRAVTEDDGRGYEILRQLELSKTKALQQDLVDDILSEFGYS